MPEFGPESQPTVTMPGYSVYRDADNPSRFKIHATASSKTAGITSDIVVKLALTDGAEYHPGLPRNTFLDRKVERLRADRAWESDYGAAAILSLHGVAYKLMPDTYPVPLEAFDRASNEVSKARKVLMEKEALADAAWAEALAAAAALPQFSGVEELSACLGHACLESPLGVCVYDAAEDPWQDQCLVCGLPKDRG